jgi:5'-nucleotidase
VIDAKMKVYQASTLTKYKKVVATVTEELEHHWEKGSDLAPLVADSIIWKLKKEGIKVDVAMQNAGGVRKSLHKGDVTLGEIYDALPFFNYVAILKIKGKDLVSAFKRTVEFASKGVHQGAFPYLSGMKFDIVNGKAQNFKVVKDGIESPVDPEKEYLFATDSYIAQGGNGYNEFSHVRKIEMTQFVVSDIFAEYCLEVKTLSKRK